MNTKLTLNINQNVVEEAKTYAKENHVSLSKLIENYLHSLTKKNKKKSKTTPLVESLTGVIKLNDKDDKTEYLNYLEEKYK